MKVLLVLSLLMSFAMASENDKLHLPKSFSLQGGKAVFADFSEAEYSITYDLNSKLAKVKAEIKLETFEAGFPIFDSVVAPTQVSFDGSAVTAVEAKTPNGETTLRYINKMVTPGLHTLVIDLPLVNLVEFSESGVKSAFWTSDLDERKFLERYLPANFEFDQVKMTFLVKFLGAKNKQSIYTNGIVESVDANTYKISYPAYYTASSIFYHTVPQGATAELRFTLKSID